MNAEIISVGTELVLGDIVNTNARFLSQELAKLGISVYYQSSVGDNPGRLKQLLATAVNRSNVIVITGGLGPTEDDLTLQTVCDAVGITLVRHEETARRIQQYFDKIGRELTENNLKQALVPEGATVFNNSRGTAPGCAITKGNQSIILLPGPPSEMETMYRESVVDFLAPYSDGRIESHFINIYGLGEAQVAERLASYMNDKNPTVAPYCKDSEVQLRVTAKADTLDAANKLCDKTIDEICKQLGSVVYGIDKDSLQQVAVAMLKEKKLRLATAESCTAGLLSKKITDIPGSSSVFITGMTTYSNESKIELLHIDKALIDSFGAVSPETARAMAEQIRVISGADIGVGITGIAGPGSDDTDKPVGLVYIALAAEDGTFCVKMTKGDAHSREYVRNAATCEALNLLRLYLLSPAGTIEGVPLLPLAAPAAAAEIFEQPAEISDEISPEPETASPEPDPAISSLASEKALEEEQPDAVPGSYTELKFIPEDESEDDLETTDLQNQPKKSRWYVRFLRYLFPWKGDPAKEIIRKTVFLAALVTFIIAGVLMVPYFTDTLGYNDLKDQLIASYKPVENAQPYHGSEINPKFNELYAKNKDLVGWITVNGTKLNNPVVKASDNDHYLRRDYNGNYNRYGTLFADSACNFSYDKFCKNQVIYGHNMGDGEMFGQLTKYSDLDFYKQNPTISFDSLYHDGEFKVFAVMITNANKEEDQGQIFDYRRDSFASDADFLAWIEQCRIRSVLNTGVDILPTDQLLTLQTCVYDFKDARYVVMARRLRPNEKADAGIDKAAVNNSPLYPQAWYDKKGGKKPEAYTITTTQTTTPSVSTRTTLPVPTMPTGRPATTTVVPGITPTPGVTQPPVGPTHATEKPTPGPTAKPTSKPTEKPTEKPTTKPATTAATEAPTTEAPESE